MACNTCIDPTKDESEGVNLLMFNQNREIVKDPNLPDSKPIPTSPPVPPELQNNLVPVNPTKPVDKNDLPSLKKMAFSITEAIKDNLIHAAQHGKVLAAPVTLAKRMDICTACEFFIHDSSRCSKCGCFMNMKVRLEASKCPESKW